MKKHLAKILRFVLLVLVLALGIGVYVYLHLGEESTDDATIDGRSVALAPKVAGYVVTLNIDDNQQVKKGDVLLEIDPTDYQIRRDRAQAELDAAEAAYDASSNDFETTNVQAPSNIDAAQAEVDSGAANYLKAQADLKRVQNLSREARSQEQVDHAVAAEATAKSDLENAKAKLRSAMTAPRAIAAAKSQAQQLEARVRSAKADLAQADYDLANTKLIATADGHIAKRGVEKGDYLQPGQQVASLVSNDLWVIANFKETQLTKMHRGQRVDITVDAYPDMKLSGKIDSVQSGTGAYFSVFPPENATGNFVKIVQRVPVKIVLDEDADEDVVIGPGMSVVPTVYTDSKHGKGKRASAKDTKDGDND